MRKEEYDAEAKRVEEALRIGCGEDGRERDEATQARYPQVGQGPAPARQKPQAGDRHRSLRGSKEGGQGPSAQEVELNGHEADNRRGRKTIRAFEKPFDTDELVDSVNRLIDQAAQALIDAPDG